MTPGLRPATDADFAFCEALNRTNMAPYLLARGIAWDPARYRAYWLQFENLLIDVDGDVIGVLRLLDIDGALEIRDLQLLPACCNRGIGSWAIREAARIAVARRLPELRLRVYEDNPARRLYARHGFVATATDADGKVHMACRLPVDDDRTDPTCVTG